MIEPIQTEYKGYKFRSRLEARWAVFFDALELEWAYEYEGFDCKDSGWYLPDFWLPESKWFVEIKGATPSIEDQEKINYLDDNPPSYAFGVFVLLGEDLTPRHSDTISHPWTVFNAINVHDMNIRNALNVAKSERFGRYARTIYL